MLKLFLQLTTTPFIIKQHSNTLDGVSTKCDEYITFSSFNNLNDGNDFQRNNSILYRIKFPSIFIIIDIFDYNLQRKSTATELRRFSAIELNIKPGAFLVFQFES